MSTKFPESSQPWPNKSTISFLRRSLAKLAIKAHKNKDTPTIGSPMLVDENDFFDYKKIYGPALPSTDGISPPVDYFDGHMNDLKSPPSISDVPAFDLSPREDIQCSSIGPQNSPIISSPGSRRSIYAQILTQELSASLLDSSDDDESGRKGQSVDSGDTERKESHYDRTARQISLITCHSEIECENGGICSVNCASPQQQSQNKGEQQSGNQLSSPFNDAMAATAGFVHSTISFNQSSHHQPFDPIEKAKREITSMEGGGAEFTVAMDLILSKLIAAMSEPNSAYLFRDFAGHFITFLDRFGPGGYDSHRAPKQISWMFKLILPWTYIDDTANEISIAVYKEVNGWIRNITQMLGSRSTTFVLEEGTWDSCVEHMASSNPIISDTAYRTAKAIITCLPFGYYLVCKVLLIRNITFGYDDENMGFFRFNHVRLLSRLVERMDNTKNRNKTDEFSICLTEIISELKRTLAIEADIRILGSIESCLDYANIVYRSLDALGSLTTSAKLVHDIMSPVSDAQTSRSRLSLSPRATKSSNCLVSSSFNKADIPDKEASWYNICSIRSTDTRKKNANADSKVKGQRFDDSVSVYTTSSISTVSSMKKHFRRFFGRKRTKSMSASSIDVSAHVYQSNDTIVTDF